MGPGLRRGWAPVGGAPGEVGMGEEELGVASTLASRNGSLG